MPSCDGAVVGLFGQLALLLVGDELDGLVGQLDLRPQRVDARASPHGDLIWPTGVLVGEDADDLPDENTAVAPLMAAP